MDSTSLEIFEIIILLLKINNKAKSLNYLTKRFYLLSLT